MTAESRWDRTTPTPAHGEKRMMWALAKNGTDRWERIVEVEATYRGYGDWCGELWHCVPPDSIWGDFKYGLHIFATRPQALHHEIEKNIALQKALGKRVLFLSQELTQ